MAKEILIIDDEPDFLTVVVARVESAGYKVVKAASAEEACAMVKKHKPDLILLDLLLPNMQGDAFCKQLKSNDELKNIPVIIVTASIIRIPEKVKEIGADDYLLKPFEPEDLLFKIKKFIG